MERHGEFPESSRFPPASTGTCTAAPRRCGPIIAHRFGGTHRGYWDYEGGGLSDMGQHHFDPVSGSTPRTTPARCEIEAYAPPAHSGGLRHVGLGRAAIRRRADGGDGQRRVGAAIRPPRGTRRAFERPAAEDQKKIHEMPDPEPLVSFPEAVKTRKQPGGHAEAAHRAATLLHLANIAIRTGRTIHFDPVKEQIIGDDEANRLVYQTHAGTVARL